MKMRKKISWLLSFFYGIFIIYGKCRHDCKS